MSKQLLALFVITLITLGLGASYIWTKKGNSEQNIRISTLGEWQQCRDNAYYKMCDEIKEDEKNFNECQNAAKNSSDIIYPGRAATSKECLSFWDFYNYQQLDLVLPQIYFTCIEQGFNAAMQNEFFFKHQYQILWINCAMTYN